MTKLIDGFDLCDLSPLPHAAHPHCDHPRRVDPSNEIQMLQSSCVKLRRHPGCYPVGGKTINELLRNVLKILWSNFLMGTSVWAPLPICGTRGVRLYAFSPSPSLSLWDFLYEKNNNERSILKSHENISQYAYLQYILLYKNNLNKISYH